MCGRWSFIEEARIRWTEHRRNTKLGLCRDFTVPFGLVVPIVKPTFPVPTIDCGGCRYFTVPFVLVVLNMKPPPPAQLLISIAIFAAIDAATIYVFLFRPFAWPDDSLARFMW